jgi:hypothetical protein
MATPDVNVQVPEPLNVPIQSCADENVMLLEPSIVKVLPDAMDNNPPEFMAQCPPVMDADCAHLIYPIVVVLVMDRLADAVSK